MKKGFKRKLIIKKGFKRGLKFKYPDYQNTIRKLAYRFSQRSNIPFDEFISAGNEEFIRIQKTHDSSLACFNTYLYMKVRGLFLNIIKRRKPICVIDENISTSITPYVLYSFATTIKELPNDAKEVIKIAFETPIELIQMMPKKQPRGINKTLIKNYLRKNGWVLPRIFKAFKDIESIWH